MFRGKKSAYRLLVFGLTAVFALLIIAGCGGDASQQDTADVVQAGEKLFNANCSACHGVGAVGTNQGPP